MPGSLRDIPFLKARATQLRRARAAAMRLPAGLTKVAQSALGLSSAKFGPPRSLTTVAEELDSKSGREIREAVPRSEFLRNLPLDPVGYKVSLFQERQRYIVHPQYVIELPKGRCVGESGWVIDGDDHLYIDLSIELGATRETHSALFTWKFPPMLCLEGSCAVVTSPGRRNYAHWMLEALPRLELLKRAGLDMDAIDHFLIGCDQSFRSETLAALGIGRERLIFMDGAKHVQADRLLASTVPGINGNPHPWAVQFLRSLFPSLKPWPDRRLYISRGRKQGARSVINEDELMDLLAASGFVSVSLEDHTVAEQARMFASAEMVVAPHGAGLTNLAFATKGVKVLEIYGPKYINPIFWTLADVVGAQYAYVIAEGEIEEKPRVSGISDPMTVDLKAVERGLACLIA